MVHLKKKFLILLLVLALVVADVLYWTAGLSLGQQLPARVWGKAQLWHYNKDYLDSEEIEITEEDFGFLAAALENTRITRRPKFQTMSDPWFYLVMQRHDGALVILTVVENGDIAMDPGTGKKQYYDGGQEFYQSLLTLANEM